MASSNGPLAQLRRAVFARHANPWSAWSRWATTPLLYVPVWTRRWSHAAFVGVWFAVNPVVFPRPEQTHAWSTRAMLGEELWISERPRDRALVVNSAAGLAGLAAVVAARKRRFWPTATATAVQMGLTLVYWQQMAHYYEGHRRAQVNGR
ncbi:hypothetical protein RIF23_05665 [Lipingzhangella sp. LS1_29]|uniref:TspO/MBR related protein n=1 Tax=Lipingzhangella rawalii TaxID=2055835 RepID=A0ABU2H584_9ACTN|nr:DUF6653 family protein [Lipingzhangella rawalii]MDS1269779.1 hypothetical protein [Lipingzhangella rawalii]